MRNENEGSGEDHSQLILVHEHRIEFIGLSAKFTILGRLSMDLSAMKVSLGLEREGSRKQRIKMDLYDYNQIEKRCVDLSEKQGFDYQALEADLLRLTDLLEAYREDLYKKEYDTTKERPILSLPEEKAAILQLEQKYLIKTLSKLLDDIGIVGEVDNRMLLFIIGSSYKAKNQLHALVQSTSGSGKSHLINSIAECFPCEDVVSFSRVTSKSLYHYKSEDLTDKLIVIQDMDGLDHEALYALRELQSLKSLTTSTTFKDRFGNLKSRTQTVTAQFSSFGATTHTIYTDNESRSVLLKVDESAAQTKLILQQQHKVDRMLQQEATSELQNMIRVLRAVEVVNPFAEKIVLPSSAKMLRRLNKQFLDFVSQITFLHQFQRKEDKQGRVITTKSDVKLAIDLFFDSIWLKVDELEASQRSFYERLKEYMNGNNQKDFTQREIRQAFKLSSTTVKVHLKVLVDLEYLIISSGSQHRGYKYEVQYWDDAEKQREEIKKGLLKQLASG